jgi:predicted permease
MAMGARRGRLIRQLLTESLLLAVLGGVVGVLFAYWLKEVLLSAGAVAGGGSTVVNAEIDLRVLAFTIVLSSLTGILFGIAPAWRATGVDLNPALKDMGRSPSVAARSLLSKSLVVVQVAMSLLLLIGAGLFLRTMINLQNVDPGFNMRNLLLFSVDPSLIGYRAERLSNLYKQMSERIEAIPNVEAVTFSRMTLLAHGSSSRSFFLPGTPGADGTTPPAGHVYIHEVRENFLEALEIPVLAGRGLSPGDDESSQKVAVVNQTFARRYLGDQDVIGKRFGYSPDRVNDVEIVGLVRDAKYASARDDAPPTAYLPWQQELRSVGAVTFEVRTSGEPSASVTAIRQAVRELDEGLPLNAIKTQIEQADETLAMERLFTRLLNLFGLLAQLLAAIGLYGVLAYGVSQRSREIGIRMALGASRSDVLKMILKQGMILTIVGVAAGLVGAYVLTKYLGSLTSLLYGVDAADPLTFGLVAAFLTLVALAACFVPARTATRVDPMVALRYE